jgi:hypothetical protein
MYDVYGGMNGVGAKTLAVDIIQGSYESYKMWRPENEEVSLYSHLKKYLRGSSLHSCIDLRANKCSAN